MRKETGGEITGPDLGQPRRSGGGGTPPGVGSAGPQGQFYSKVAFS